MTAGRPHGRNDPSLIASLETALRPVRRPGPAELTWNWRRELGILAALAAAAGFIASSVGLLGLAVTAGAGLAASAATLLCCPSARHWVIARAWCLITPHRVRAGCASAWVQTRSGRLPFVLATKPTACGERVRLWLFAGLTAADLEAASGVLAGACWAAQVRVVPSARHAHLVTLEVIRTPHPERKRPAHSEAWPTPRRLADEGLGIPSPRLSPEEDGAELDGRGGRDGRSWAHVPDDEF
jgi:hypothetical protein